MLQLHGTVVSGTGTSSTQMQSPDLMNDLEEAVGVRLFPGSLNLFVDDVPKLTNPIRTRKGKLWPARLNGRRVYFKPKKRGKARLYAPVSLRKTMGLRDGDRVTVELCDKYLMPDDNPPAA